MLFFRAIFHPTVVAVAPVSVGTCVWRILCYVLSPTRALGVFFVGFGYGYFVGSYLWVCWLLRWYPLLPLTSLFWPLHSSWRPSVPCLCSRCWLFAYWGTLSWSGPAWSRICIPHSLLGIVTFRWGVCRYHNSSTCCLFLVDLMVSWLQLANMFVISVVMSASVWLWRSLSWYFLSWLLLSHMP